MDRIDFYLLHSVQDGFIDQLLTNGCIDYFDGLKRAGAIRFLGFSYHGTPQALPKMLAAYPWDFVQIQLNYYDWYCESAQALYDQLTEAKIPVMVMEPVHGGLLAKLTDRAAELLQAAGPGRSLASWAMRWVLGLDNVQTVLSGMGDLSQVEENLKTFDECAPLTDEERRLTEQAAKIERDEPTVACTECRYCCPNCPAELDIPALIRSYNEAKIGGAWRLRKLMDLPADKRPSACVGCGSCTAHCPQSFGIPSYMSEMAEMMRPFEKPAAN